MTTNQKPLVGTQKEAGHPLSNGLVGSWLMNEGSGDRIYDSAWNGNDLTSIGSPTHAGGNLEFNGTSDGMLNVDRFKAINGIAGSVAFKVMPISYGAGSQGFWEISNGTGVTERIVLYNSSSDFLFLFTPDNGNYWQHTGGSSVIPINKWSSVVVTYIAGGKSTVYVDGTLVIPDAFSGNMDRQNNLDSFQIASFQPAVPTAFLNAIYDYVYIYDRILTSEEVSQLQFAPYQMFQRMRIWKIVPSITPDFTSNLFKAHPERFTLKSNALDSDFTFKSFGDKFTHKAKDN